MEGTKAAVHSTVKVQPNGEAVVNLRFTRTGPEAGFKIFGEDFEKLFEKRKRDADEFYSSISPPSLSEDKRRVMRQALAGMLWSKQYYYFDLERWLEEHGCSHSLRLAHMRNSGWTHMVNNDVISMPNKWEYKLRGILTRMLDEERFLGPHGVRALSRWHKDHPYVMNVHDREYRVQYMPAESNDSMFGGNSNWRGPVWMPLNILIVRALLLFYQYYGDDFLIECPTGSGVQMNLFQVAEELSGRLAGTFFSGCRRTPPGFWQCHKIPNRSALARLHSVLRVFSWRQRSWDWRQPSNWVDWNRCQADSAVWRGRYQGSSVSVGFREAS
jgi:hypothetical protein